MTEAAALARKHLSDAETLIWADHARLTPIRDYLIWGGVLLAVLWVYHGQLLPVIDAPSQGACATFPAGGECFVVFHLAIPAVPLTALVFVIYRLLLIWQISGGRAYWLWVVTDERIFRLISWPCTRIASFVWPHEPPWPDALGMMPFRHRRDIRPLIGPITPEQNIALRAAWKRFDENRRKTRSTVPQSRPFS